MRKIYLITAIMLFSTILSAQKATQAELNASKIIDMTNSVVDLYNDYLRQLKKGREGLEKAENNIETLKENINRSAYSFNCNSIIIRSDYIEKYEKAGKAAPIFPEKTKIQAEIKYIQSNNNRLAEHCSALNNYFTKKEYKEDEGFAKYQPLYDSLYNAYKDLSASWSRAVNLSSEAGDRSELILLKKSPIAEFIIPMKTDLSAASKILEKFSEEEVDYETIVKDIDALKQDIEKHKSLTGKNVANLEKNSSKANYGGFYSSMEEFVNIATTLEELMNPAKPYDKDSYREDRMNNNYSMLREKYNSLISSYNLM